MARKTNKTNHVLNLLSSGVAQETLPEQQERKEAESAAQEADLAEQVRESLEQELAESMREAEEEDKEGKEEKEQKADGEAPVMKKKAAEKSREEPQAEHPFLMVNVMQRLTEQYAEKYMKQFGNCMCDRCRTDVTALALTKLPAKYVVVNKDAISILMNFYDSQYCTRIIVEVTKACITVSKNPHHEE